MSEVKLVVVPERMILSSEFVEAVSFHCGDGEDNSYGDYQDGILFIGVLKDDEGRDVYGLHIASGECEEEGYSTLVEFEKPLPDYDALAAQRDEGLAREAELRKALQGMLEYFPEGYSDGEHFSIETAKAALAFPGCADGEKAE